jgi:hypothetical protein
MRRNLDDGTYVIHPHRFTQLAASTDDSGNLFIPVHKNFCIVAIAAPVPLFPGHPLDPLFHSRFQVRFVNPVGMFLTLCPPLSIPESELESRLCELVLSTQYASETPSPPYPRARSCPSRRLPFRNCASLQQLSRHRMQTHSPLLSSGA